MKALFRKSERRIKFLTSKLPRPYPNNLQTILHIIESKNIRNKNLYMELFDLLEKKGIDVKKFEQYQQWASENWHKHYSNVNYNSMPKLPYKDSKTYKNSRNSGFHRNANKIRYPKKCRKTAWKRFYKLFPHLLIDKNVAK